MASRPTSAGWRPTARKGVLLLLADSTNVEREGHTLSERTVGEAFADLLPALQPAGHCRHLLLQHSPHPAVVDAARLRPQNLVNGRSMVTNTAIARQLGYLPFPTTLIDCARCGSCRANRCSS
jgi:ribonuclease J